MGFTLYKFKKQECRGRINQILVKREVLDNNQGDIKFFCRPPTHENIYLSYNEFLLLFIKKELKRKLKRLVKGERIGGGFNSD